ncbi:bifunctional serine/threonine-protein kinase/formylglycine-generating enzyme family protein [Brasilonema sennae]|nr:bifunctional serine/threonine-protein kinase/formylglycine-generating enzyme family protein [Brasilonema sennae]
MFVGRVLRNCYKILRLLGNGGFGDTYLAENLDLPGHPLCVVKHLKPRDPDPVVLQIARRLFASEAQVLYKLGHENNQIPRLFAHFEENGEFYLVQEYVEGSDLSSEVIAGKRWSEQEVTQLLREILEILTLVHKQDIIHRDIKPQNLMRRREDGKIILIDFGAVKEISTLVNIQGQTSASVAIGTPGYAPNEQAAGYPKLSSDVHAVGMLAIFALTGVKPHDLPRDPTNGEVVWRNWANVSERFADILTKMVRYRFSERYQSAAEALSALPAPPKPKPQRTPQSKSQPASHSTLQSTLIPRRQVIQTLGLIGSGVGLAIVGQWLLQGGSLQTFNFETVTVDAQGNINNRSNRQAKYFAEDLGNRVTLEMVQIPGGTFIMGSPPGEKQRDLDEGPQHPVTVPGFFMGKYEVTQAQYQAIMGNNPSKSKGEKRPVEKVTWDDAVEFCKRLKQKTGRTYRLPSEAEWEYAARAGTTTPFYFGETITTDLANYNGTDSYASEPKGQYRQHTTDVGIFRPNAFGLYDMHGLVWEWCQDDWHDTYQDAPTDGSAWLTNDSTKVPKMLRGGSWNTAPRACRSADRLCRSPDDRYYDEFGFRVVCVVA